MRFIKPISISRNYALFSLDQAQYHTYACNYQKFKKVGIKAVYAWAIGAGVLEVAKEISVGAVCTWGRIKLGSVIIGGVAYICPPAISFITNSTTIINGTRRVHSAVAFVLECADDLGGLAYLPLDMAIFGQPIPMGDSDRFNWFKDVEDFIE